MSHQVDHSADHLFPGSSEGASGHALNASHTRLPSLPAYTHTHTHALVPIGLDGNAYRHSIRQMCEEKDDQDSSDPL